MKHFCQLTQKNSIANQYLAELRQTEIQKDSMRFRRNMERIGEIFALEISKTLTYKKEAVNTPLGVKEVSLPEEQPVVMSILRAGRPLHSGLVNYFDKADGGFISAYRKHFANGEFEIKLEYISCPPLEGRTLILCDPMLATGASLVTAYKALRIHGLPKHVHLVTAIASQQGVDYVKKNINDENYSLWVGDIDDDLSPESYIVPGLGDAGDLAFGEKVQK